MKGRDRLKNSGRAVRRRALNFRQRPVAWVTRRNAILAAFGQRYRSGGRCGGCPAQAVWRELSQPLFQKAPNISGAHAVGQHGVGFLPRCAAEWAARATLRMFWTLVRPDIAGHGPFSAQKPRSGTATRLGRGTSTMRPRRRARSGGTGRLFLRFLGSCLPGARASTLSSYSWHAANFWVVGAGRPCRAHDRGLACL